MTRAEDIRAVLAVAARIRDGESLDDALMSEERVPVDLRLLLAAAVLIAADKPVNKRALTAVAPAARSAAYRDHSALLERLLCDLPHLVRAQLKRAGTGPSVADLAARLQRADQIVAAERLRVKELERDMDEVLAYARELHWALKPEYETALAERAKKVTPLRLLDSTRHPRSDQDPEPP